MKKILFLLTFLFCASVSFAQMADNDIINYVKQANAAGTSKEEIAAYLMKRGVTQAQLEKIKKQYESEQTSITGNEKSSASIRRERAKYQIDDVNSGDFDEITAELTPASDNAGQIFGRNIFNTKNLSFTPNTNIPTPADYHLGPGDEVIIDIWGASQTTVKQTISPEGNIMVDRLGPLYLNGMTIREANDFVQKKFASIFSAIDGSYSEIKLTLGQIRTIQINVMGEAVSPGTYSLSSLSSVFHALYMAGGVNPSGSLRNIKLIRNGKVLRTLDVYKYILDGKLNDDIRLTDNDVISIPTYAALVNIAGSVKRPMYYEMTDIETVNDLIRYSGGFSGDAYTGKVRLTRITGDRKQVFTVPENEYLSFHLKDKDVITISNGIDLYENRVEISGAVFRTGYYEIGKNINTVKDLIEAADGLRGDAFKNRAVLTREKEDFTSEVISLNIEQVLSGVTDIPLRKNDALYIPSVNDLKEYGDFTIHGAIARPGDYKYAENTSLEDLIVQAGGLLESASTVKVDVARRIADPKSTSVSNIISQNFTLALKDGFLVDSDRGFVLMPYDQIYVRKSPAYETQRNVNINGEVLFSGTYSLYKKTERISDVVKRAGGLTPDAYPKGARLIRKRSAEEVFRTQAALRIAQQSVKDSISINSLDLAPEYNVGIELDKAIGSPGSDYDLVMREGDRLIVPELENTIKINGAVMYPNTVSYRKGQKLAYYIEQAGGYADFAKKRKVYVINMNGTVSKVRKSDANAIQPGSEIIVPSKDRHHRVTVQDVVNVGASVAPLVSLVSVMLMLFKK